MPHTIRMNLYHLVDRKVTKWLLRDDWQSSVTNLCYWVTFSDISVNLSSTEWLSFIQWLLESYNEWLKHHTELILSVAVWAEYLFSHLDISSFCMCEFVESINISCYHVDTIHIRQNFRFIIVWFKWLVRNQKSKLNSIFCSKTF